MHQIPPIVLMIIITSCVVGLTRGDIPWESRSRLLRHITIYKTVSETGNFRVKCRIQLLRRSKDLYTASHHFTARITFFALADLCGTSYDCISYFLSRLNDDDHGHHQVNVQHSHRWGLLARYWNPHARARWSRILDKLPASEKHSN